MEADATPSDPVPAGADDVPDEAVGGKPPSRRAAILRTGLVIGILVLVFGVILPRFVDYQDVIDTFRSLTILEFGVMLLCTAIAWLVSGAMFAVLVPGTKLVRGTQAYLILSGIGASVPMGPWNMAVLWAVMRGWGVAIKAATSGIALYGIINTLTRLVTPALALLFLAAAGLLGEQEAGFAILIAILCTVVLIVAIGLMLAIVRSDRSAHWVADASQRIAASVARRLGRPKAPDVASGLWAFRNQLGEVVRQHGLSAMIVGTIGQLVWCGVLIVALRIVGIASGTLTPAEVLAVFAMTSVITIIPIAPGGAGIPELLYIAGLTAIAGPSYEALITAGVMLFRMFQWFLPIPIAWVLLKVVRRGRPMLPTPTELRAFAKDGQTA